MNHLTVTSHGHAPSPWQNQSSYEEPVAPYLFSNAVDNRFKQPQEMCTRTTIQDFPSDYKGKVDILCPNNRWKKVYYEDILLLQERNLTDPQLTQLLEANLTMATMAKVATEVPDTEGKELVEYILGRALEDPSLTEPPGIFGYLMRVPRYFGGWFQTNQAPKSNTEEQKPNDEVVATLVAEECPLTQPAMRNMGRDALWDGTVFSLPLLSYDAGVAQIGAKERIILSKKDYDFLKEGGLSGYHFYWITEKGIFIQKAMGIMQIFPGLKRAELFDVIMASSTGGATWNALERWKKDPSKELSLKKGENYPKALVLISKDYLHKQIHEEDRKLDHVLARKLYADHNVYFEVFRNIDTFTKAIKKHNPKVLVIKTHGTQQRLELDTHLFFSIGTRLNDDFPKSALSHLAPKAHIIFMTCEAGKGRNNEINLANFFALNSPPGVTVVAPTDSFHNFQLVLEHDSRGNMIAGFWNYKLGTEMKEGIPLSQTVQDITYRVSSMPLDTKGKHNE